MVWCTEVQIITIPIWSLSDSMTLKDVIQSFKCEEAPKELKSPEKVTKPRHKKLPKKSPPAGTLEDLPPLIKPGISVVFVGFNPGVESSLQQHHYAHFTNLFWKLFNHLDLLRHVLQQRDIPIENDSFLESLFPENQCKAAASHDNDLLDYGIGFTDLVLRCTKMALELSMKEKIANVPRLLSEFQLTNASFIVIIGKGIWEIIVKYLDPKYKLTKTNFVWGFQNPESTIIKKFHSGSGYKPRVYVFPNTSGLVALMKYPEKLALWELLVLDIKSS